MSKITAPSINNEFLVATDSDGPNQNYKCVEAMGNWSNKGLIQSASMAYVDAQLDVKSRLL